MSKFKPYDVVRYASGETAIMQLTQIAEGWASGIQFYGGYVISPEHRLEKATEEEREKYVSQSVNRNTGDFESLVYDLTKWQAHTFPKRSAKGILNHLHEEVVELLDAPLKDKEEEAADVFLLLLGYCDFVGVDILQAARKKFTKCTFRTYGKKNEKGYFTHDSGE